MNGIDIIQATTVNIIPELIIDNKDIGKAGFVAGEIFKIEQVRDGLIITLTADEAEIERLLLEVDVHPHIGADWIRDNGELYLAGEWLTQSGLTGQPLAMSVMPSKVVIRGQQGNMSA